MSKEGTLITLGILIAVSPFLGLPLSFLAFALPILGAITLFIGYTIRKERVTAHRETPAIAPPASHEAPSSIA